MKTRRVSLTFESGRRILLPLLTVLRPRGRIRVRTVFLFLALLATLATVPFHARIRSFILERGLLANNSPDPEMVEEMIDASSDPQAAIRAAWNTGRIIHREIAIDAVKKIVFGSHRFPAELRLPAELLPLVEAAAFDPDLDVREEALDTLRQCQQPGLATLAAAQLRDCDPEVRLLGVQYLRWISADTSVPSAVRLLDDPDPRVVVSALIELQRRSGQNFGVKLTEIAAGVDDEKTGFKELHPGSELKSKAGAERARVWWGQYQAEYTPPPASFSNSPVAAIQFPPGAEFDATALNGRKVRLSDYRGKAVVLFFWTTSNGGCLNELDDLMALKRKYADGLAIIGVSLDNVKDDDGGIGDDDDLLIAHRQGKCSLPTASEIREKVASAIKDRGVDYPIILDDEHFCISGMYNASAVPTTVMIDNNGLVRRRFYGRRSLPVLEAMLDEFRQPTNAVAQANRQSASNGL